MLTPIGRSLTAPVLHFLAGDNSHVRCRRASFSSGRRVGSRDDAWDGGSSSLLLSNSFERADCDYLILVFIPCHIEPDMRFALIRLSDNLLPAAFKV